MIPQYYKHLPLVKKAIWLYILLFLFEGALRNGYFLACRIYYYLHLSP